MRMNLDRVASGGKTFIAASSIIAVGSKYMPATKVCPQCKAAVPVRWKTCKRYDDVFRSKRKAECNLREKAMKRMRAVESDSVRSARKAKDKLHKACERAPEIRERTLHRQKQNRMCMASISESQGSDRFQSTHKYNALLRRGFGTFGAFHCSRYC